MFSNGVCACVVALLTHIQLVVCLFAWLQLTSGFSVSVYGIYSFLSLQCTWVCLPGTDGLRQGVLYAIPGHECLCLHAKSLQLFVTPCTVARQAPLSVGFFRQEYWSGLPCPPLQGIFLTQGSNVEGLTSRCEPLLWAKCQLHLVYFGPNVSYKAGP